MVWLNIDSTRLNYFQNIKNIIWGRSLTVNSNNKYDSPASKKNNSYLIKINCHQYWSLHMYTILLKSPLLSLKEVQNSRSTFKFAFWRCPPEVMLYFNICIPLVNLNFFPQTLWRHFPNFTFKQKQMLRNLTAMHPKSDD